MTDIMDFCAKHGLHIKIATGSGPSSGHIDAALDGMIFYSSWWDRLRKHGATPPIGGGDTVELALSRLCDSINKEPEGKQYGLRDKTTFPFPNDLSATEMLDAFQNARAPWRDQGELPLGSLREALYLGQAFILCGGADAWSVFVDVGGSKLLLAKNNDDDTFSNHTFVKTDGSFGAAVTAYWKECQAMYDREHKIDPNSIGIQGKKDAVVFHSDSILPTIEGLTGAQALAVNNEAPIESIQDAQQRVKQLLAEVNAGIYQKKTEKAKALDLCAVHVLTKQGDCVISVDEAREVEREVHALMTAEASSAHYLELLERLVSTPTKLLKESNNSSSEWLIDGFSP